MSKSRSDYGDRPAGWDPDWATVNDRVRWLVSFRFTDNRSAMAKAIGFSHTVIANVVKGKPPGPRLLEAIATRLGVDSVWLRTGEGQPFLHTADPVARLGMAMTDIVLPGPPLHHQALITDGWIDVPEFVPSTSTYLLKLNSSQAIIRTPTSWFRHGDELLMETDPAKFPLESRLHEQLCVVRTGPRERDVRLADVTHYPASIDTGEAKLTAEFPEEEPLGSGFVDRVYRHYADGRIKFIERHLNEPGPLRIPPRDPVIRFTDIVAVWLKIMRRPWA